jgi:hypothetical protein
MRGASIVAGVVEPLPLPIGEITSVDLEITHRPLRTNGYAVALTYDFPTTSVWCSSVIQRESVEAGFELRDCGCIVPLVSWEKFTDSLLELRWRIT